MTALFSRRGGAATYADVLSVVSRRRLRTLVMHGEVASLWHGIYAPTPVTVQQKLTGARLAYRRPVTACLGTAAQLFGFDTESVCDVHILDDDVRHPHGRRGLVVHQRHGAPVVHVAGHRATAPAWTAVELARLLPRPRALATLDAALATGHCTQDELRTAAERQTGRRGIVQARELVEIADGRAQSPMESETRLVLVDGHLPAPHLQLPICDADGVPRFYVDLAWEDVKVCVEYDGDEFHTGALAVRRDRARIAWLQDRGWLVIVVSADDVRRRPDALVARVRRHLVARRVAA